MSIVKNKISSKITGVVSCVPSHRVENSYFENSLDAKVIADIAKLTKVSTRYWSEKKQTTVDLCTHAASHLEEVMDENLASCDALIFISQTPDHILPGSSFVIHKHLNLPNECLCLDINSGCSGYVIGLSIAQDLISGGRYKKVLLLVGDTISKTISTNDRSTAMIFGDAGTATLIEASTNWKAPEFIIGSDSNGVEKLKIENGLFRSPQKTNDYKDFLFMDGSAVFNFTIQSIPKLIESLSTLDNKSPQDFDYILMHQANAFMLKHISKKAKLRNEQVPINIQKFGNTSSASIPLLLCSNVSEVIKTRTAKLALLGFGVGFSWAAVSLEVGQIDCAEVIYL